MKPKPPKPPRCETFSRCFDRLMHALSLYQQAFTKQHSVERWRTNGRIRRLKLHRMAIIAVVTQREQAALIAKNPEL